MFLTGGRATGWSRGPTRLPTSAKLRMPVSESVAVRLWGISFIVERETTQNSNSVSYTHLTLPTTPYV